MSESPKDFLKRRGLEPLTREERKKALARADEFLANPPQGGVFFYPACGSDYAYPLRRFASSCDTFIFCDWQTQADQWEWLNPGCNLPNGISCTYSCLLESETVEKLGDMKGLLGRFSLPPNQVMVAPTFMGLGPQPQWARYAELLLDNGKALKLFFFCLEGVNLYRNLFTAKRAAPLILCIKNWGHIGGEWTCFGDSNKHLGQIVWDGPPKPKYLIIGGNHNWPYPIRVQDFPEWRDYGVTMWARTKAAAAAWQRKQLKEKP